MGNRDRAKDVDEIGRQRQGYKDEPSYIVPPHRIHDGEKQDVMTSLR